MPDYYHGINLSAAYKGFDLSVFLQGVPSIEIYNYAGSTLVTMQGGNNQLTYVLGRWKGEGTSNTIPRASRDDPNGNNRHYDSWIAKAHFMRINFVQLGYTIPVK